MQRFSVPLLFIALVAFGAGCAPSQPSAPEQAQPAATDRATSADAYAYGTSTDSAIVTSTVDGTQTTSTDIQTTPTSTTMTNGALTFPGILPDKEVTNKIVRLKTTKGEIVFELLPKEGPRAASNFVYLANKKFYDGLTFHRVVPGFVIQGGDPQGDGTGGPGYSFEDDPVNLPYNKGIVAMANAGPNTNGSQFFIMLDDNPLPPSYSIFGRVLSGQDVVSQIQVGDKMTVVTVENKK